MRLTADCRWQKEVNLKREQDYPTWTTERKRLKEIYRALGSHGIISKGLMKCQWDPKERRKRGWVIHKCNCLAHSCSIFKSVHFIYACDMTKEKRNKKYRFLANYVCAEEFRSEEYWYVHLLWNASEKKKDGQVEKWLRDKYMTKQE